jgi:hypothetical protein
MIIGLLLLLLGVLLTATTDGHIIFRGLIIVGAFYFLISIYSMMDKQTLFPDTTSNSYNQSATDEEINSMQETLLGYTTVLMAYIVKADPHISKPLEDTIAKILTSLSNEQKDIIYELQAIFESVKNSSTDNHRNIIKKMISKTTQYQYQNQNELIDFFDTAIKWSMPIVTFHDIEGQNQEKVDVLFQSVARLLVPLVYEVNTQNNIRYATFQKIFNYANVSPYYLKLLHQEFENQKK